MTVEMEVSNTHPSRLLPGLKETPHWMCWYYSMDDEGDLRKKPYPHEGSDIYKPGIARYNSEQSWLSYSEARDIQKSTNHPLGIGFVITEKDDYIALDIDDCMYDGNSKLTHETKTIIESFSSYTEISPSKTGVHIIVKGQAPTQGWTNEPVSLCLEIFNKYFITVSQLHMAETPIEAKSRQDNIDEIFKKYNIEWSKPRFTSSW